jgi:hypothetical protein
MVVLHSDGISASGVDSPLPPHSGLVDEDSDHEHHVGRLGCPTPSVQVPIHLRLGQRSRSGHVDDNLMSVQAVDQDLVKMGSVDAPALPVVSVEELEAPDYPPDLEMYMAMYLGSVDALALPKVLVAELEAPGHPSVLALDLTEDLGVSCQVDCSSQDVLLSVRPCSDVPLEVVHVTDLEEVVTVGQHGSGFSHLVVNGSSAIVSSRVRRLGSCQSSSADRWKSKPPCLKFIPEEDYLRLRLSKKTFFYNPWWK